MRIIVHGYDLTEYPFLVCAIDGKRTQIAVEQSPTLLDNGIVVLSREFDHIVLDREITHSDGKREHIRMKRATDDKSIFEAYMEFRRAIEPACDRFGNAYVPIEQIRSMKKE